MVLIFDLDDTLYAEITYVHSGLRAVAEAMQQQHGWDAAASFALMKEVLRARGRGAVFDALLASHSACSRKAVRECVTVYRHHAPRIALAPEAAAFLRRWPGRPYLVTDGHKVVQAKKVEALGLEAHFRRIYITHRYGVRHAKPSPYCFDLIRRAERCEWSDLVYVGDNPAKDFVALNALGGMTVRVLTGEHRVVAAKAGHDGHYRIDSLRELESLLLELTPALAGDAK
jgi:putative hydrolase of the HAD superfamily